MGVTCDTVGSTLSTTWGPFGRLSDNKMSDAYPLETNPTADSPEAGAGL